MRHRYTDTDKQAALAESIRRLEQLSAPSALQAATMMRQWLGRTNVDWMFASLEVHRFRKAHSLFGHDANWAFLPFGMRANDIYCGRVTEL